MYGKLFTSMWDGSLYGKLEASAVLMACVTLCNAQGVLDMTPESISGRTGWPIEFVRKGIHELEQPDPRSRTPDDDGRRLARIDAHRDWGWIIVNYEKYRTLSDPDTVRAQTRERVKKHRDLKRAVTTGNDDVTVGNAPKRQAEAEAEAERGRGASPRADKLTRRKSGRVPADFEPDAQFALTQIPDLDVDREIQKFRDWEFKTPRSDWPAVWRNWIGTAKEIGKYAKSPARRGVVC